MNKGPSRVHQELALEALLLKTCTVHHKSLGIAKKAPYYGKTHGAPSLIVGYGEAAHPGANDHPEGGKRVELQLRSVRARPLREGREVSAGLRQARAGDGP